MLIDDLEVNETDLIAGVDEVGRGPLAGPVVAAAVILDPKKPIDGLCDSKKMSANRRLEMSDKIKSNSLAWSLGRAEVKEIDEINILQASLLAMKRAIELLNIEPDIVLVDGNYTPSVNFKKKAIVKGDSFISEISAASIIAKVHRDRLMTILSKKFTQFTWNKNAGYGTKQHLKELISNGPTIYHRKSFEPIKSLIHNK